MPRSPIARRKLRPAISSPTTPARRTSAPRVRVLTPTLVAPPGTIRSSLNSRMSTGASREMRAGLPIRYSSATISPITRTRLPRKLPISERKRKLVRLEVEISSVMFFATSQDNPDNETRYSQHTLPAPGFTIEAIHPLYTHTLHKFWCAPLTSRDEIEGSADTHSNRDWHA